MLYEHLRSLVEEKNVNMYDWNEDADEGESGRGGLVFIL